MARIAERAGVSRQTVYNEFGNKHGLAEQLAMRELARFLDVVRERMAAEATLVEGIRAACEGALLMGEQSLLVRTIVTSLPEEQDADFLQILTTESGEIVEAAVMVVKQSVVELYPPHAADRRRARGRGRGRRTPGAVGDHPAVEAAARGRRRHRLDHRPGPQGRRRLTTARASGSWASSGRSASGCSGVGTVGVVPEGAGVVGVSAARGVLRDVDEAAVGEPVDRADGSAAADGLGAVGRDVLDLFAGLRLDLAEGGLDQALVADRALEAERRQRGEQEGDGEDDADVEHVDQAVERVAGVVARDARPRRHMDHGVGLRQRRRGRAWACERSRVHAGTGTGVVPGRHRGHGRGAGAVVGQDRGDVLEVGEVLAVQPLAYE